MPINKNELTKEQITKAMSCETAEELIELAKSEGIELTKEEAEAYMAEMADMELDGETLAKVAGGKEKNWPDWKRVKHVVLRHGEFNKTTGMKIRRFVEENKLAD